MAVFSFPNQSFQGNFNIFFCFKAFCCKIPFSTVKEAKAEKIAFNKDFLTINIKTIKGILFVFCSFIKEILKIYAAHIFLKIEITAIRIS